MNKTSNVLVSADGVFQCTPEHAVGEAYLLNCASGILGHANCDRHAVGEILTDYCENRLTLDEALAELKECEAELT